ncbi:MAG: serine hydrolase [Spirochaetales bacterium]|nr:serine hydrolase [Spirochaetales bacterium]
MKKWTLGLLLLIVLLLSLPAQELKTDQLISLAGAMNGSYSLVYRAQYGEEPFVLTNQNKRPIYDGASLGKTILAALVLSLESEGRLVLRESVSPWLDASWSQSSLSEVTPSLLLTHSAGYSNGVVPVDKEIHFPPGSQFSYSGAGYIALQEMVESIMGEEIEKTIQEQIFQPFGMENSSFVLEKSELPSKAIPHAHFGLPILIIGILALFIFALVGLVWRFLILRKPQAFNRKTWLVLWGISTLIEGLFMGILLPRFLYLTLIFWGVVGFLMLLMPPGKKGIFLGTATLVLCCSAGIILGKGELPIRPEAYSQPVAAYTLQTTAEDLGAFCHALLSNTRKWGGLFEAQVHASDEVRWTHGLALEGVEENPIYWHTGSNMGYKNLMVMNPQTGMYLVVLSSSDQNEKGIREMGRLAAGGHPSLTIPGLNSSAKP